MKISYRLVVIAAVFVTCLITSNIIAVKIVAFGSILLPAAVFVFPLSYLLGDVLTEVYGYGTARKIIWLGFACNLAFVLFAWVGQVLPPASFWTGQSAYETILGYTPRLLLASFTAYLVGEFVNSYVLARMKIMTRGRWLWTRTIGSTVAGQALDTVIFITISFVGTAAFSGRLMLDQWVTKVGVETILTPLTYAVVNTLKRQEGIDTYDTATRFNPFGILGRD